jgi:hypothetical protein
MFNQPFSIVAAVKLLWYRLIWYSIYKIMMDYTQKHSLPTVKCTTRLHHPSPELSSSHLLKWLARSPQQLPETRQRTTLPTTFSGHFLHDSQIWITFSVKRTASSVKRTSSPASSLSHSRLSKNATKFSQLFCKQSRSTRVSTVPVR